MTSHSYTYRAVDSAGVLHSGALTSASRTSALDTLSRRGLVPLSLDEAVGTSRAARASLSGFGSWQRVVQDGDGRQIATVYDAKGQVLDTWRGGSGWIGSNGLPSSSAPNANTSWTPSSYAGTGPLRYGAYLYNGNGKKTSETDSDGNQTSYGYDGYDRLTSTLYADGKSESLWYTVDGTATGAKCGSATWQPCRKIMRSGQYVNYTYDVLDRRATRSPQVEGAYTYGYDLRDQMVSITKAASGSLPAHTTTYQYDNAKRKTQESNDGRLIGYAYDANGNRTNLTWPDLFYVQYKFDALNRMTYALENGSTELAYYSYDTLSRRSYICLGGQSTSCQSGGGTNKTSFVYEPDSDISSLTHVLNGSNFTLSYGHNHSHQITSLGSTNAFYLPEPAASSTVSYTPAVLNQYSAVGGNVYQYDTNANLKTLFPAGGAQTYTYDSENRLISAAVGGSTSNSIFYDYDAAERRATKTVGGTGLGVGGTTTNYLADGNNEIAELDGSGNVLRRYIPGPGVDDRIAVAEGSSTSTPTLTYFHTNHEGSVLAMTDATGNPSGCAAGVNWQTLSYDEYGNLSSSATASGEVFRYTGRRFDVETGLYYYRTRYYAPQIGRFMQVDPIGSNDDSNLYAYSRNDPVDRMDMGGKWSAEVHRKVMIDAFGKRMGESMVPHSLYQDLAMGDHNYMHYLRDPGQSPAEAVAAYRTFVQSNLNTARELAASKDKAIQYQAQDFFTSAVHAIMDSFSPVHDKGGVPQEYDPSWGPVESAEHGHSPLDSIGHEGTKDLTPATEAAMVALLRAAYQYVYGAGPMPEVVPGNAPTEAEIKPTVRQCTQSPLSCPGWEQP